MASGSKSIIDSQACVLQKFRLWSRKLMRLRNKFLHNLHSKIKSSSFKIRSFISGVPSTTDLTINRTFGVPELIVWLMMDRSLTGIDDCCTLDRGSEDETMPLLEPWVQRDPRQQQQQDLDCPLLEVMEEELF